MDGGQIGVSEGEQQLRTYCLEAAEKLGIEVDHDYWSDNYIDMADTLNVFVKTDEQPLGLHLPIDFSYQEIDDYASGIGTDAAKDKIREALEDIAD